MRWTWLAGALAAAPSAPPAVAESADAAHASGTEDPTSNRRAAVLADEPARTRDYPLTLERDEAVWLEAGEDRSLALFRPVVHGEPRGVLVVLLDQGLGPEADSTSVSLRHTMPRYGWATLLVRLPDATAPPADASAPPADASAPPADASADAERLRRTAIRARLDAAVSVAHQRAGDGAVILFAERAAAAWAIWSQRNGLAASALAVVDVDAKSPLIDSTRPAEHLRALPGPALVLIEAPRQWSPDDPLSADTELQLLPAGDPSGARIERVLRGWIKRRLS